MTPHAIIADDEPNLADYLKVKLNALWPELTIDGVARNGAEALHLIDEYDPTIAFLDIKMPGLSGLEVASRLDGRTHVVFVTAFDQFAVEAFEREAVDYLLKPVTDARLAMAIERLKSRLTAQPPSADISALLAQLMKNPPQGQERLRWIRAGSGASTRQIPVEEVLYFDAADKYTRVVTADGESLIRLTIRELTEQLDSQVFTQIHRGTIVNMHFVADSTRDENGQVTLRLKNYKDALPVSRAYAHLFRQM